MLLEQEAVYFYTNVTFMMCLEVYNNLMPKTNAQLWSSVGPSLQWSIMKCPESSISFLSMRLKLAMDIECL